MIQLVNIDSRLNRWTQIAAQPFLFLFFFTTRILINYVYTLVI